MNNRTTYWGSLFYNENAGLITSNDKENNAKIKIIYEKYIDELCKSNHIYYKS